MTAPAKITAGRENGRSRPRGYADWRPQAKTRALLEAVEAVLAEYEEQLPLTVRQIFYRLVATIDYPKSDNAYGRLCEALVRARRAKLVPFEYIRDDGVVTYSPTWYDGPEGFWDHVGEEIKTYRRDRQDGQPHQIELWCESAGMAPQLARVASNYSIPVFSSGGFLSLTAVRQIVDRARDRDMPTVLLHVGDCDPSGKAIFDALAEDAQAFLEEDRIVGTQRIEAVRVALTAEQVEAFNLPTAPPKSSDGRSDGWDGGTCQLEALAPDELAEVVRRGIEERIPRPEIFNEQVDLEGEDQHQLWRALPAGGVQ